jgi:hypothetical protein
MCSWSKEKEGGCSVLPFFWRRLERSADDRMKILLVKDSPTSAWSIPSGSIPAVSSVEFVPEQLDKADLSDLRRARSNAVSKNRAASASVQIPRQRKQHGKDRQFGWQRTTILAHSTRQLDLNAVCWCDGEEPFYLILRRRQRGRRSLDERHTNLEEHLLQTCRGDRYQHLRRLTALVLE